MATGAEPKRLMRSRRDRIVAGVCGGLAAYLNIDPTLVRLLFVVLVFASGGILLVGYVVMWLIMPEEETMASGVPEDTGTPSVRPGLEHNRARDLSILGLVLMAVGAYLLLRNLGIWSVTRYIWPVVLIGLGFVLLLPYFRRAK